MKWTLGLLVVLSGCASAPSRIPPAPTSTAVYRGMSCAELSGELQRINDNLGQLAVMQDRSAHADVALMTLGFVVWPAWIGLAGTSNYEAEIARLKGEGGAVRSVILTTCRAEG